MEGFFGQHEKGSEDFESVHGEEKGGEATGDSCKVKG